jgi:hypothetical protein
MRGKSSIAGVVFLLGSTLLMAGSAPSKPQSPSPQPISKESRFMIIRGLNAEFVFVRRTLPMGMKGLTIKDGEVTPGPEQVQFMAAQYGPAARPGDRAQITDVRFHDKGITFEVNGGPKKKKKWYQHIEIAGMGGMTPVAPDNNPQNPHGSFVDLEFDHFVPDMTPDQVKQLLAPVFDFSSLSAAEAYIDTMPPKVKAAMKNHEVLVGMNREMVMYSKGKPDNKIRERDSLGDYEEWIYGTPPAEVEFVRFYGDIAKRVEIMKVDGEKVVRTEPEVTVAPSGVATVATAANPTGNPNQAAGPGATPANAPSLRRPGEQLPNNSGADGMPAPLGKPVDSAPPPVVGPGGVQPQ